MAAPIEQLAQPLVIVTDFGSVTLTHKAYGFTFRPWDKPKVISYTVKGVIKNGNFVPYAGTEQYATWKAADMQAVNREGATLQEILAQHDTIITRDGPSV